jgi:ABC-type sugar transport system ATPase subunit/ribose/xylose/arabinose/galactoside ABC-type transport system permease subunit
MSVCLQTLALSRRYPGVTALDGVSLELQSGRVHALVGENGAGKSTLIKILAGVEGADDGEVRRDGRPVVLESPGHARRAGIAVVHQQPHLIPDLTVMENLALRSGYPRTVIGSIAWGRLEREATRACAAMIPSLDVSRPARSLGGAEQTLVELSFALASVPAVLILDEPTARLPRHETEGLLERVRELASRSTAVLIVTHRLDEVFAVADEVTVLRDGKRIWRKSITETDNDDLIRAMVGRTVEFDRDETCAPGSGARLTTTSLSDRDRAFTDVSLTVRRGEIYGIYGLVGAGQSALGQALSGLRPTSSGTVRLDDASLSSLSPGRRVRAGWAHVPADRHVQGLFPQMSVGENLGLGALVQRSGWGWIDPAAQRATSEEQIQALRIKTTGPDQVVAHLSGGNQQKVLLGRWIRTAPRVLLLEEPTQGVDVAAKREIHGIITSLAKSGVSVVLVSSELPELMALAHRIGILRQGRLVAEHDVGTATEEELLRASLPDRQAEDAGEVPADRREATSWWRRLLRGWARQREASLATLIVGLALVFAVTVPGFAAWPNLRDVMLSHAILLVSALGMTAVIIAGGIDISVGAILGLAATTAGLADAAGWPAGAIAGAAIGVGAALGAVNGALSVFGRVHSIVVTLGTLSIFRGAIILLIGGRMLINLSPEVTWLRDSRIGGLPALLGVSLFSVALVHVFLAHLPAGRRLFALGGDRASAGYLGVAPRRTLPLAFAVSGALSGLAGLMWASRFGQVQSNVGQGFELAAIAAAVLGGTHIMGGRGSALGTFLGAMFLGMITNVLVLAGVSVFWERALVGAMILLALAVDRLASGARGSRT